MSGSSTGGFSHLPGAEGKTAVLDWHRQRCAHEAALDVRRHVVHALVQVPIMPPLGCDPIKGVLPQTLFDGTAENIKTELISVCTCASPHNEDCLTVGRMVRNRVIWKHGHGRRCARVLWRLRALSKAFAVEGKARNRGQGMCAH